MHENTAARRSLLRPERFESKQNQISLRNEPPRLAESAGRPANRAAGQNPPRMNASQPYHTGHRLRGTRMAVCRRLTNRAPAAANARPERIR